MTKNLFAQTILDKIFGKSSKIGQDFKNLLPNIACFYELLSKFNFWKKDWELGCVSTKFDTFLIFPGREATRVPNLLY